MTTGSDDKQLVNTLVTVVNTLSIPLLQRDRTLPVTSDEKKRVFFLGDYKCKIGIGKHRLTTFAKHYSKKHISLLRSMIEIRKTEIAELGILMELFEQGKRIMRKSGNLKQWTGGYPDEELVKKEFPDARVLRMDMDTTKEKGGHEKILEAFANEEADILIGTQMIVKGHDFPNVTLVGVLAADLSLYADDYRAGERTFQLLTQAAGRAGRGSEKGEVVIQTYSPEHYSIETAAKQDYEAFYPEELAYRTMMGYPPVEQLAAILVTSEDESLLETACSYMKSYAERMNRSQVRIIGPASPYVGKVNDVYRRVIYLKHARYEAMIDLKNKLEQYIEINSGFRKVRVQFDFNPMNVF